MDSSRKDASKTSAHQRNPPKHPISSPTPGKNSTMDGKEQPVKHPQKGAGKKSCANAVAFDPDYGGTDDISDEDAAKSDEEWKEHGLTLKDITPRTPLVISPTLTGTPTSTISTASQSRASTSVDASNGEFLIQLSVELRPNMEHMDTVIAGVKAFLEVLQREDPTACILPRFIDPRCPIPALRNVSDEQFPSDYLRANKYIKVSNAWVLSQPPVDKDTLRRRLADMQSSITSSKRKKGKSKTSSRTSSGPTSLYAGIKVKTAVHPSVIDEVITGVDITLSRTQRVKASLKQLQCWDSSPKYALLGVNNGVDKTGVEATLLHHLKAIEKKLCRSGKLKMEDYYDLVLPPIHVYLKKLRELSVPDDEREHLTFTTFAAHCQFVFHIEASDEAWTRLEPLLDIFVRGNGILRVFGPTAHLMAIPTAGKVSISEARIYQSKGRIGMAYNAATAVYDCSEVMNFDLEVKVKMAERTENGQTTVPPPPYKRTTLRKELSNITFNGQRIFHSAIKTMSGPDTGISRITVPYDPRNPHSQDIQGFAKHTLGNLACFFFHWWTKEARYHDSTVKRLMTSFYFDRHVTADESTWDPATKRATSRYASAADTWLEDNAHLDPKEGQGMNFAFGATDEDRQALLSKLNYKENQTIDEVNSGPSAMTGDDQSSGASSLRSETSEGLAMGRTTELKMRLAKANSALADRDAAIRTMQEQLAQLLKAQEVGNDQMDDASMASGSAQERAGSQAP